MAEKIYYDDNIFYLNEILKTLDDGLHLDIDADLFLDKIVEDILFVDSALSRLYRDLAENELLIKRANHLKRLIRGKTLLADLLDSILQESVAVGAKLHPFFPKFRTLCQEQRDDIIEIRERLTSSVSTKSAPTDVVSQQEYHYLLLDEQASEEPA